MSDLPDVPNQFMKSDNPITTLLEDYCTIGLEIPLGKLHHWDRPADYDAYRIHTVIGLEFVVSGPQLDYFRRMQEDIQKIYHDHEG